MSVSPLQVGNLLRAGFEQRHRLLVLHTPLGANRLLAEALDGEESIDAGGFRLELSTLSDDAHIPLKSLIGQAVRLDLQTAQSRTELRPFHGHVTEAQLISSNGGFARYRLVIEPWFSFLQWRQDSYLFQDKAVFDIVEAVFADYQTQGKLSPQWRWDIADRSVYPQRGITTQYNESDLAFVTRLLAEEGLFYWFEHQSASGESLGQHTMVIADHAGAFKPNAQAEIRFHRADASEAEDSIQQWHARRQLQTNSLSQVSWDYKSVSPRPLQEASNHTNSLRHRTLHRADDPGHYAWETSAQGARLLRNAIEALELRNKAFEGEGTARTLSPASTFTLTQHPVHDRDGAEDRRFAVLTVRHVARNNLDEDLQRAANEELGAPDLAQDLPVVADDGKGNKAGKSNKGNASEAVPHYRNHFSAVRAAIPYRPLTLDGKGRAIHPKPTIQGSQSAIVIGAGDVIHTDRDHRIKVQFHWQRGGGSSSRLAHPAGDNNAPAAHQLGAWVRVATAMAGTNWGQAGAPRTAQEVLVDYLHGDIDRPVVVAALYNGQGEPDAQYNRKQLGAANATGNAPAWFAGQEGEHAHNAVYSGIKTQEMRASQSGTGGYNQLVFDDTPQQSRLALATTQASSRLHLGHHKQQNDNQRGKDRGHGAELATTAQGAIRAGSGLLVSAHAQPNATGPFMASREAQNQTTQARELAESLAESAQTQKAMLKGEAKPDKLEPMEGLKHVAKVLGTTEGGSGAGGSDDDGDIKATGGGQGTVTAWSEPHLQLTAPMGIGIATPKEAVIVSGQTSTIVANEDIDLMAQGQAAIAVAKGVSLYTVGTKAKAEEPNTERGISLHAASGKVKLQSQSGATKIAADKKVTIASVTKEIEVEAPTHVLLTVGGAYVKLEGSSIKIHAPGRVMFHGMHSMVSSMGDRASNSVDGATYKGCAPSSIAAAASQSATVALG
ncbi:MULTISPECIES: type VI secretion system Vgr family protein [unclassified Variovorax]|uniref:type VI secretion system Vgr family protein n=1 Tax=unclassified Variovorax TaxID=663243 RepID=UPI001BD300C6|nr:MULTISPECIES: type VI secretion system Vgr family protein [unclassified Variovorax]